MRFNIGCVLLWALHNLTPGAAWAAASASKAASAPVVTSNCTRNADCTNGICSSDGLCGLQNGQACVASSQCRTVCAADGRCGVAAAHFCTSNASCRSNACNADNACGYLMGAKCDEADACRSGVCQNTTCVANCAADTACQTRVTYCDNANTQLCTELLADAQPCTRDTMCQAGVCGSDGLCGAINTQSCTSADACRSGACQSGACSATCASDANCKTGTFCDAATQTCTQTLSAAQACGRDAQCDGGVCAADGLCGALSGGNCTTPKTCRGFVCAADFVCRDSCSADADCDHTHYCSSAVCVPRTGNGQACTLDTQCLAGLCNVLGTCGQLNGGACARGDDCVGGACSPNDLRCGLLFNAACANLDACRVGYCNTAGVCAPCSDNADCPMGACNKATGSCNTDPNYAGVGLEGGGCAQVGRTGLGALLGALTLWMGLRGRRKRGCHALWALWLVLGVGLPAHAAGFALQRFVPTDPGQMQLRVDKPWYAQERTRLDVGLVLDVGHNPLVYKTLFQNAPSLSTGIVTAQFNAVLQAAVSWTSWLTLSAHLPFVLVETGQQAYG